MIRQCNGARTSRDNNDTVFGDLLNARSWWKKREIQSDSWVSNWGGGGGSAVWWCFQNIEQFGGKKGCVGIQDEMTTLKTESRAGNTCVRIFMLWMLVEILSVDKLAWKSVESENRKVIRTIRGWPIFKRKTKSWQREVRSGLKIGGNSGENVVKEAQGREGQMSLRGHVGHSLKRRQWIWKPESHLFVHVSEYALSTYQVHILFKALGINQWTK